MHDFCSHIDFDSLFFMVFILLLSLIGLFEKKR